MTTRPHLDERDPQEPRPWTPTSAEYRRREALERTREAVQAAKDARKKDPTEETPDA